MPGSRPACSGCEPWPPDLLFAISPFAYEGTAAAAVRALKYGRWRSVAIPLAEAMASSARAAVARLDGADTALVPVPLGAARLRERGFNQADELATHLAGHLGVERISPLTRAPGRGRQAGAGRAARRRNVHGRFACGDRPFGGECHVLLIDDVVTTGSTLIECASVLRVAGFGRIGALTFARTLRRPPGPPGNRQRDDRGTV